MSFAPGLLERKQEAVRVVRCSESDTGSVQVQVVDLTARILFLAEHVSRNKKDFTAKRRLEILVGKRRRFLSYLRKTAKDVFASVSKAILWSDKR
jgi:small subunit ribosomal protein S15